MPSGTVRLHAPYFAAQPRGIAVAVPEDLVGPAGEVRGGDVLGQHQPQARLADGGEHRVRVGVQLPADQHLTNGATVEGEQAAGGPDATLDGRAVGCGRRSGCTTRWPTAT